MDRDISGINSYSSLWEITTHDIDINNNIRPTSLAKMMEETGTRQMRDRKPSYYDFFFQGKTFIVTRMSTEILGKISVYDKVRVHTWMCPPKAATLRRCFAVEKDGILLARSYSEWTVADMNTGKLCMAKDLDLGNYETDQAFDMNVPVKFRHPRELDFKKVSTKEIRYSDVDMNLHMNNTGYHDMVWQYIPDIEKKEVTSSAFRFMAEGTYKTHIDIYMAKADETMDDGYGAEETWCFYTKVLDGKNEGRKNIECYVNVKNVSKGKKFKGE